MTGNIRALTIFTLLALACTAATGPEADAQTGTLIVTNKGANTASIIDLASGRTVATLPTGNGPHEVAATANGRWALVTNYGAQIGGNSLTLIDVEGARVQQTIDLGSYGRPHGVVFLPGDSLAAITVEASNAVLLVRVPAGEIARVIDTGQDVSHMITNMTAQGRAYTSNIRPGTISELNLLTGERLRILSVAPAVEAIQINPEGDEVWVGSNSRGTVNVVNVLTGEIEVPLEGFSFPYRILFTPDDSQVIIPDFRGHVIRFVDPESFEEITRLAVDGAGPQGVTTTPDASYLFVSLSLNAQVAMIDLETHEIVRTYPTGSRPDGVAFSSLESGATN